MSAMNEVLADKCVGIVLEMRRLEKLPARELIAEVLTTPAGDNLRVIELMNRVLPGWEQEDPT